MAEAHADTVAVTVFRYDPDSGQPPRYDTFTVPHRPRMVVGEALEYIYTRLDPSLAFRYECRTQQCGSCTVQVDGQPTLFCRELIGERRAIRVEPVGELPIIRDLVTDRGPLLDPLWLIDVEGDPYGPPGEERGSGEGGLAPVALEDFTPLKLAEDCAECMLCTLVCPAFHSSEFPGPMFLNKLARYAFDSRSELSLPRGAARLAELAGAVDHCKTCLRCEEICPHEIPVRQLSIARLLPMGRSHRRFQLGGRS